MEVFRFFQHNYLAYASTFTAGSLTSFDTATLEYAYDNRSDIGYLTWPTITGGTILIDFGAEVSIDSFLVLNTNAGKIYFQTSLTTVAYSTSIKHNAFYSEFSVTTARYFQVKLYGYPAANNLEAGEIVLTSKKFNLNYNPSVYEPSISPVGVKNELYTGRVVWNETGDIFSAKFGYDYLIGNNDSMTGTDLQNLTALARQKPSFLFYPAGAANTGTASYPNIYGWRPQDIFKCRILDAVTYSLSVPGRQDIIRCLYNFIEEV